MKHAVASLEGALLDAAVAKAEGWEPMPHNCGWFVRSSVEGFSGEQIDTSTHRPKPLSWSTDWQHGGPIIERERIDSCWQVDVWAAYYGTDQEGRSALRCLSFGPTKLVASMRAFVASKFGAEVDL